MGALWAYVRLVADLWSIKVLVSLFGRNGELLDSHFFFYVRYADLADFHRLHGRIARADRLDALAEAHYLAAPDDDEPPAVAMAMPLPRRPLNIDAVSKDQIGKPAVAPRSDLVPSPVS